MVNNMGFKKGLYLLWSDYDYIKKCTDSGTNQILIANQNTAPDDKLKHWGQYEESKFLIWILSEYYKDRKDIDLIFLPLWMKHYRNLPENQRFNDGEKTWT